MLTFQNGVFEWAESGLTGGTLAFEFEKSSYPAESCRWDGTEGVLPNGMRVSVEIKNQVLRIVCRNGKETNFLRNVSLTFPPALCAGEFKEYTHSRLFLEQTSGVKPVGLATPFFEHNPPSYTVYLLAGKKSNLLLGALPPHQGDFMVFQAVHESASMRGRFGIRITAEQDRDLSSDMTFEISGILFECSEENPLSMLEKYAERYVPCRPFPLKDRAVGWNSWDQFRAGISAEDVLETERKLRDFSEKKVRYYVVDDGWQIAYGAWTPNMKFPSDLSEFCKSVRDEGGIPGIWSAPVCVDNGYMFPKGWILRTVNGTYALDISRPDVQKHLHDVYSNLYKAGFRYFKIDFTNRILDVPHLSDMRSGRAGLLRKLYGIIRDAIGPDSYLLGCCVPYEPAFGLVDAVRTTADIQIFWSAVEINMTSASARWFFHRRLWNNDSDFVVVRGPETSGGSFPDGTPYVRGKYASGPVFSRIEAMTLCLALYMTGGDLMISDNFLKLNESGKSLLNMLLNLPPLPGAARPEDLFTAPSGTIPMFWHEPLSGRLAVFNWGDEPRSVSFRPADFGKKTAGDCFWNPEAEIHRGTSACEIVLKPHESAGFLLI